MFDRLSRYRRLLDVVAPDARGRVLSSRDLRPLPQVSGTFRHTVRAGDRLDQLAFQYYGQVLQWWHICDANPQFMSPLSLTGAEPVVTTSFPVSTQGDLPWPAVFQALTGHAGVEDVAVAENVGLQQEQVVVSTTTVTVLNERFTRAVLVTHNRLNITAERLASLIEAAGFQVGPAVEVSQLGQEIVIPPAVSG